MCLVLLKGVCGQACEGNVEFCLQPSGVYAYKE